MGCKIVFSPQAIADLESSVRFIAKDNPEAAVRVANVLLDRVSILEHFLPLVGSLYLKRPGVRKLVSRPYIIYYRPRLKENCVDILRYWHGARRAGIVAPAGSQKSRGSKVWAKSARKNSRNSSARKWRRRAATAWNTPRAPNPARSSTFRA